MSVEALLSAAKTMPVWAKGALKGGGIVAAAAVLGWTAHGLVAEQSAVPGRVSSVETAMAKMDTAFSGSLDTISYRLGVVEQNNVRLEALVNRILCHLDKQALGLPTLSCVNQNEPGG